MIKTWKLFLVIIIICGVFSQVSHSQGSWTEKASTPKQGGYGEAIIGTGDYIYTLRAYSTGVCNFWKYNPTTNTWSSIIEWTPDINNDPIPRPKSGTSLAWDGDDIIYILFGAAYSDTGRRFFYSYDISENTWEKLANTPSDQGAGDALTWSGYDGECYALLGSKSHGTNFARYNPGDDSWETLSLSWSSIDDGASLTWTGDEYIFALRGEYEETTAHTDTSRFNIESNSWSSVSNIPASNGVGDGASLLWIGNWDSSYTDVVFARSGSDVVETPGYGFYSYSISENEWSVLDSLLYPVGYYVGNRLGYVDSSIFCWQGAPSTWEGEGDRLSKYMLTIIHPSVDWIKAWGPGGRLDPGGDIAIGEWVRMYTQVSDSETPSILLDVTMEYLPPGGSWTPVTVTYLPAKDYWYYDWDISGGATLGSYDVRVTVEDEDTLTDTSTETGEFNVVAS